jgi:putative NADH-flavin reductase
MKVAIIGATGRVGSRTTNEALSRGHEVIAIARGADALDDRDGLTKAAVDLYDTDALAAALDGAEAVVFAYRAAEGDKTPLTQQAARSALDALKKAGISRFLAAGGAGSLVVEGGGLNVDQPGFPDAAKPTALATVEIYYMMQKEDGLDWTYLCPSSIIFDGERTGIFRTSVENLITDDEGNSKISFEDYAVAMVDELENPQHGGQKWTVGY